MLTSNTAGKHKSVFRNKNGVVRFKRPLSSVKFISTSGGEAPRVPCGPQKSGFDSKSSVLGLAPEASYQKACDLGGLTPPLSAPCSGGPGGNATMPRLPRLRTFPRFDVVFVLRTFLKFCRQANRPMRNIKPFFGASSAPYLPGALEAESKSKHSFPFGSGHRPKNPDFTKEVAMRTIA
jgi:hypothetical protein